MHSSIFEKKCLDCSEDVACELCGDSLCEECKISLASMILCRPCSVSIRNENALVSYFVKWHDFKKYKHIKLLKEPEPTPHKYLKGNSFSCIEFEGKDLVGSITYRSDGQCDAHAVLISTEEDVLNEYRILVTNKEIDEFLRSLYSYIDNYKCG